MERERNHYSSRFVKFSISSFCLFCSFWLFCETAMFLASPYETSPANGEPVGQWDEQHSARVRQKERFKFLNICHFSALIIESSQWAVNNLCIMQSQGNVRRHILTVLAHVCARRRARDLFWEQLHHSSWVEISSLFSKRKCKLLEEMTLTSNFMIYSSGLL